jgi:uncharacterized membrane protein
MGPLVTALHGFGEVAVRDRFWMLWNLTLATVPLVLAVAVFRYPGRRGAGWWLGAGLMVLFLPNAPYVLTDLVHLRGDVVLAGSDTAVVGGVLPVYAGFIAAGFVVYTLAVGEVGRYLERERLGGWRVPTEVALHAVCAVGVVLGRIARLNSWEPVTQPHSTAERIMVTLTWRGAPAAVLVLFVCIWVGYALTRGVGRSIGRALVPLASALAGLLAPPGPQSSSAA